MNFSMVMNFIVQNAAYIMMVIMGLLFIALCLFVNINIKLSRMEKKYKKLMTGMDGCNIERILMGHIDEVRVCSQKMGEIEQENKRIDLMAKQAVQKVGVVRFSAFDDIGSDLSYAVALLDHHHNGVVLTSIFGREESRCYAKPILNGVSTYMLTEEEKQAIQEALKK